MYDTEYDYIVLKFIEESHLDYVHSTQELDNAEAISIQWCFIMVHLPFRVFCSKEMGLTVVRKKTSFWELGVSAKRKKNMVFPYLRIAK